MRRFNPLRWIITLFKKNAFFNVLRMATRLVFFPGYVLYFFLSILLYRLLKIDLNPINLFFYAYSLMVFLDVVLFEVLKLKESSFKDEKAFFKKNRFSPKRIDWHARFLTRVRVACLVSVPFIASYCGKNVFEIWLVFMVFFPVFSIWVYANKVAHKHPFFKWLHAWADKHIQYCPPKITDGLLGYDSAGIPTMSRTAVGGSSS